MASRPVFFVESRVDATKWDLGFPISDIVFPKSDMVDAKNVFHSPDMCLYRKKWFAGWAEWRFFCTFAIK